MTFPQKNNQFADNCVWTQIIQKFVQFAKDPCPEYKSRKVVYGTPFPVVKRIDDRKTLILRGCFMQLCKVGGLVLPCLFSSGSS